MTCQQVILHVGTGRTGTSTIQSFLRRNRPAAAAANGFFGRRARTDLVSYPQEEGFWEEERLKRGLQELNRHTEERRNPEASCGAANRCSPYILVKNAKCAPTPPRLGFRPPAIGSSSICDGRTITCARRTCSGASRTERIRGRQCGGRVLGFDDWLARTGRRGFRGPRATETWITMPLSSRGLTCSETRMSSSGSSNRKQFHRARLAPGLPPCRGPSGGGLRFRRPPRERFLLHGTARHAGNVRFRVRGAARSPGAM